MRIAFFGSPEFALPSLIEIQKSDHKIDVVISQPDKPRGRKLIITPTPVKEKALEFNLSVLTPLNLNEDDFMQQYKSFNPEVNVVIAYGRLMPDWLIDYPKHGTINAHASLLPRWRGAAPIRRAIMAGDKKSGVTIQHVVQELDAGDIALREEVDILPDDNNQTLSEKLAKLSAKLLVQALDLIKNDNMPKIKQDDALVTYAEKITKDDLKLDFNLPAEELLNKIRALAPKPGAYTFFKGKRLKILKAKIAENSAEGFVIAAADKTILVEELQPEGGKVMSAYEFARGHKC